MWALKIQLLFKFLLLITFYSNKVSPHNFQRLCMAFLQNPNTTLQYWDMSHQITWYILAHMPCFHRRSHKLWCNQVSLDKGCHQGMAGRAATTWKSLPINGLYCWLLSRNHLLVQCNYPQLGWTSWTIYTVHTSAATLDDNCTYVRVLSQSSGPQLYFIVHTSRRHYMVIILGCHRGRQISMQY